MLVNCSSCQKKFTVPDSAITEAGRLLQCGACGNKWTQYPVELDPTKEEKSKKEVTRKISAGIKKPPKVNKINKINNSIKKKKRTINLYSEEYLKKKHGLEIKDSTSNKEFKKNTSGLNFFGYLIITVIIVIALLGILNMTKTFLITNYSFTETYINSLYEALDILKMIILNLIN